MFQVLQWAMHTIDLRLLNLRNPDDYLLLARYQAAFFSQYNRKKKKPACHLRGSEPAVLRLFFGVVDRMPPEVNRMVHICSQLLLFISRIRTRCWEVHVRIPEAVIQVSPVRLDTCQRADQQPVRQRNAVLESPYCFFVKQLGETKDVCDELGLCTTALPAVLTLLYDKIGYIFSINRASFYNHRRPDPVMAS